MTFLNGRILVENQQEVETLAILDGRILVEKIDMHGMMRDIDCCKFPFHLPVYAIASLDQSQDYVSKKKESCSCLTNVVCTALEALL